MWTRIGKQGHKLQVASHQLKKFLLVTCVWCLLTLCCPVSLWAEDISFEAIVNTNKISLHDFVQLTLTVHGLKGDLSTVPMPVVDGFEARFIGPSVRFINVNGVSSSEHSFIYNLFPSKAGHFEIPSVILTLDGQTYTTAPIQIDVVDSPKASDSSGGAEDSQGSINDKVFMKVSIEPKEVYVGQKTPLNMKVYVTELSLQLAAAPYLTPKGFTADKTASMQKNREVINGLNYETMNFLANIYPTQSGDIDIGPFQATGELLYRSKQSEGLLGLLSNVETRPITLRAPAILLHVLPLPTLNQPKDFYNAVGQYDFKASVGPASVKVGDPLTLRMSITGDGQLKDLQMPVFTDNRFKSYDPQIKDNEDSKTLELVIIPTSQNIAEVPAVSFSYFDTQTKEYKTITQGPFPIKVLPSSVGQEFKAYGFVDKTKSTGDKNDVVKFDWVVGSVQRFVVGLKMSIKDWKFWVSICVVFLLWFTWRLRQNFQKKFHNDKAFARRWQADKKAKELVKKTREYLQQKDTKEFYSSLHNTLHGYLADKLHVPLGALSWGIIETRLLERSVDSGRLEILKAIFERSDLVRFASATIPEDQMHQDFEQLEDLIAYLPKVLK